MEPNKDLIERLTTALERSEANAVGEHLRRVVDYYDLSINRDSMERPDDKLFGALPKLVPTYIKILDDADIENAKGEEKLKEINARERFEYPSRIFQMLLEYAMHVIAHVHVDDETPWGTRKKQYGTFFKYTNDKGEWITMGCKFRLHDRKFHEANYEVIVRDSIEADLFHDPLGIGMK